ncbi:MAG: GNAT family N-acetyltransferase, partial [Lentisphaerae bacterium]|nr:GNAT family N-acetyltransferase [Lentisphaerota bacterium]
EIAGTPWHVRKGGSVLAGIRSRPLEAIVCEIEGSVVGYASSLLDYATGIARIGNNAVHPDHQGKGVGSAMQQEIARRMTAEGFTRFAVTTMTNDIPAQHVYEKLGYERVVGSVSYLKKGCDARAPGM